jgi:hypothetical protein
MTATLSESHDAPAGYPAGWTTSSAARGHRARTALPDHPVLRWDVSDPRRRDFYGHAVVRSWYAEATTVLDLDGKPRPAAGQPQILESAVGAGGFRIR